jgi:hypothetical protein
VAVEGVQPDAEIVVEPDLVEHRLAELHDRIVPDGNAFLVVGDLFLALGQIWARSRCCLSRERVSTELVDQNSSAMMPTASANTSTGAATDAPLNHLAPMYKRPPGRTPDYTGALCNGPV